MNDLKNRKSITWEEWHKFANSTGDTFSDEDFTEMARLHSLIDLTTVPDDVGYQDKEYEAKIAAAKAEKASREIG